MQAGFLAVREMVVGYLLLRVEALLADFAAPPALPVVAPDVDLAETVLEVVLPEDLAEAALGAMLFAAPVDFAEALLAVVLLAAEDVFAAVLLVALLLLAAVDLAAPAVLEAVADLAVEAVLVPLFLVAADLLVLPLAAVDLAAAVFELVAAFELPVLDAAVLVLAVLVAFLPTKLSAAFSTVLVTFFTALVTASGIMLV